MVYHPINSLGGMRTGSYASFLYIFKASVFPVVSAGKMDSFIFFGGEDDEDDVVHTQDNLQEHKRNEADPRLRRRKER